MTSRLAAAALAFAAALLLWLPACPGPEASATDASPTGWDASGAEPDAAHTDPDAAVAPADAGTGDASAGLDAAAGAPDAAAASLSAVSIADLWATLQTVPDGAAKGFLLINVHVPYEGSIPGTDAHLTYLDPSAIAAYVGSDLDRNVVVYCLSNYMSKIAGNDLVARGYRSVRYLDGGMSAWTTAGHPLDP